MVGRIGRKMPTTPITSDTDPKRIKRYCFTGNIFIFSPPVPLTAVLNYSFLNPQILLPDTHAADVAPAWDENYLTLIVRIEVLIKV
ncbi:hypothetical protein [Desulfallas thermosapovorans]|uniref:hypothetical protein n=1 Tax=Desulfallas thermosapovorans TaxID=58137 RepID=UPI0014129491|nr:hypothetical protein [Desulfallas thermosapovorans]